MASVAPVVTKRLSFGDPTAAPALGLSGGGADVNLDEIAGLLAAAQEDVRARLSEVEATATEAGEGATESELRRLRRQFSSLKNSFLHFETKEGFLMALMEGAPDGSEAEARQAFEQETEEARRQVRESKRDNALAEEELSRGIADVEEARARLEEGAKALELRLTHLRRAAEADEAETAAAEREVGGAGEGDDARALLASAREAAADEASRAAALEGKLAEALERAAALRGALEAEGRAADEAERRRRARASRAAALEAARSARREAEAAARWAEGGAGLVADLRGARVARVGAGELELELEAAFPTVGVGAVPGGTPAGLAPPPPGELCATSRVSLKLALRGALVASISPDPALEPGIRGCLAAALGPGGLPLEDAVAAAQAALARHCHARAISIEAAPGAAAAGEGDVRVYEVAAASGGRVRAALVACWPDPGGDVWEVDGGGGERRTFRGLTLAQVAAQV